MARLLGMDGREKKPSVIQALKKMKEIAEKLYKPKIREKVQAR